MEPHIYIEYPKCLYNDHGHTITVDNREEEDAAIQIGWMDAAKYFKYPIEGEVIETVILIEPATPPAEEENN